ncbi:sugar transporter, putative [Bodo saltans]|uniref:Sugar transporter, putative n=1 Tax=Bodo saltans TaxID=75058 RepID=A0A0S4IMM5_BODSA|nr:sugar transporter, putative [Bodo saltans]|eukprot:CUE72530.1 sugar transporter, putative [Bodo saltans]
MTGTQKKAAVYVCAALGGVLFGYDTAVVNGALFQLEDYFSLGTNSTTGGLIVSIAVCGAFIGAMIGGLVASRWGRRTSLIVADILFVVGSCTLAAAPSCTCRTWHWYFFMVVPVYLAEVTEAETRGNVISINSICICGSQFIAAVVCGILVYFSSTSVGWRWMFGLGVVPAVIQLMAVAVFLPESPRWLQSCGRDSEAQDIAIKYGIGLSTTTELSAQCLSEWDQYKIVFSAALRQRVFLGVGLQILQQFSGINTVMYYSANILKNVGFGGGKAPVLLSIPLAFTNALFTLIATFYADKLGRKLLLRTSLIGCGTATAGMMVVGILQSTDSVATSTGGWIFVGLLGIYLMFFAPGLGAMPWVVMSEIYPTNVRSTASGVATMANWASNALVSQCFPLLVGSIGVGPTFGIVAGIEVVGLIVVTKFVPETKGLTLEEIDGYFNKAQSGEEHTGDSSHLLASDRVNISRVQ